MSILERIRDAGERGDLLPSTVENMTAWLEGGFLPEWATLSIHELLEQNAFSELNDRFFQYMTFGTGGIRGRTIGNVVAPSEKGNDGTPAHPAVGSNVLNDFNLIRATIGLFRHARKTLDLEESYDLPRFVIAHDVRHFSRHFAELAASTWIRLGGQAFLFDGARSTPQLSFSVRYLKATAGAVITASHNPPHDNGFKVYFRDGAQAVEPHASAIIREVNAVALLEVSPFLDVDLSTVIVLQRKADEAYRAVAARNVLNPDVFIKSALKVVYTPIHGTGAVQSVPLLERFGVNFEIVPDQMKEDPNFPTVESPNPENAEALAMGVALAEKIKADVVLATDPDGDRMGVAVRNDDGAMELLTGNQIGSMLAEYRISQYEKKGWLAGESGLSAALIKTFVTTPMQDAIGRKHGLKVINTLTGFKWIGEKIREYEEQLKKRILEKESIAIDYDATPFFKRAELLQKYSTFYVFGGEESYGYLGNDEVRDKDANAAVLMFCELAAQVKNDGKTLTGYLDSLYMKYGFYCEVVGQIYYEGAAGSAKIKNILDSYRSRPPLEIGGGKITKFTDFGKEEILDGDGKQIPRQDFYFLALDNGCSYAVRGSGTEPKIKFYLFAREDVPEESQLPAVKAATRERLERLRQAVEADAAARAEKE